VSKRTAREMKKANKALKKQYGGTGLKGNAKRAMNGHLNATYMKDMKDVYEEILKDHTFGVYKLSPSRTREVEMKMLPDGTMKATVVERNNPKLTKQRADVAKAVKKLTIKQAKAEAKAKEQATLTHADQNDEPSNLDGMFFIITMDEDGFPDDVVSPFDEIQQSATLDDIIQQSGIKGMKWGVRHDEHAAITKSDTPAKPPGKIQNHLNSLKRERQWKSVLKEIDNLSTRDLNLIKKRIDLENDLKKYSKSKVANKDEKQYYLNRHKMSNEEMARKVIRLKAKENLHESISNASKEQREFGIKIAQTAGSIGVKYAVTRTRPGIGDLMTEYKNPTIKTKQDVLDNAIKIAEPKVTNPKAKTALEIAKQVKFKTKSKS
jgi:hypothetical protein